MKKPKRKPWKVERTGNVSVSIYRRKKRHKPTGKQYQVFEVADYSTGQRMLRSFSDSTKAVAEAQRLGKLIFSGNITAAGMRNSEAASYGRAIQLLRGTHVPLELAVAHFAEAFKILGGDRIVEAAKEFIRRNPASRPSRTIKDVADDLVGLKKRRAAGSRYVEDLESRLETLAVKFGSVRVDRITTADIQSWLDGLDAAPRTVKNFRSAANSLFKHAEARGYIGRGENPVAATESIKVKSSEPISIYSPDELTRLLLAAPLSFRPVIALQAFAGLRSAEVMRLEWSDVKLERGHIELAAHKAKTASRRLAPITPNLAEWLAPYAAKTGKVFPHSRAYFHEVQRNVALATKVEANPKKGIAAQDPVEWKHNALRHSFISYRVASVQNVPQVAIEAGNSPAMIFAHYRELVTADDAKAWFSIAPKQPANVTTLAKVKGATR